MKNACFNLNKLYASTIAMVCLSNLLGSCKDEGEGRITIDDTLPAQVTNVNSRPDLVRFICHGPIRIR